MNAPALKHDPTALPNEADHPKLNVWESGQSAATCYAILDRSMRLAGIYDLTDGMYEGDPHRDYEAAQDRQAQVLIDRTRLKAGQSLLDLGCGYGRILRTAKARSIQGRGITVAVEQAQANRAKGLDARVLDYRNIDASWQGMFDGVIANGSIEHFVSVKDAMAGRAHDVYRQMFATVHGVLRGSQGHFVTTVIHFNGKAPDLNLATQNPLTYPRNSDLRHWANLTHMFEAWYPQEGQLSACAKPYFDLVDEEDGTEDYRLTSEHWLKVVRGRILSPLGLPIWAALAAYALRGHAAAIRSTVRCAMTEESWNWQFRGEPAPTKLLRQVWRRRS